MRQQNQAISFAQTLGISCGATRRQLHAVVYARHGYELTGCKSLAQHESVWTGKAVLGHCREAIHSGDCWTENFLNQNRTLFSTLNLL